MNNWIGCIILMLSCIAFLVSFLSILNDVFQDPHWLTWLSMYVLSRLFIKIGLRLCANEEETK